MGKTYDTICERIDQLCSIGIAEGDEAIDIAHKLRRLQKFKDELEAQLMKKGD